VYVFHIDCWGPFTVEPDGELLQDGVFSKRSCACMCVNLPKEETEISSSHHSVNGCRLLNVCQKAKLTYWRHLTDSVVFSVKQ